MSKEKREKSFENNENENKRHKNVKKEITTWKEAKRKQLACKGKRKT